MPLRMDRGVAGCCSTRSNRGPWHFFSVPTVMGLPSRSAGWARVDQLDSWRVTVRERLQMACRTPMEMPENRGIDELEEKRSIIRYGSEGLEERGPRATLPRSVDRHALLDSTLQHSNSRNRLFFATDITSRPARTGVSDESSKEHSQASPRTTTPELLDPTEAIQQANSPRATTARTPNSDTGTNAPYHRDSPASSGEMILLLQILGQNAARQEAYDAARREEQRAAEERLERQERDRARRDDEIQTRLLTLLASHRGDHGEPRYAGVGVAMDKQPVFSGTEGDEYGAFIHNFEHLATTKCVPPAFWVNELVLKLAGRALSWYTSTFPADQPYPTFHQVTSGLQALFGPKYAAADAVHRRDTITRQTNETGPAALQRPTELERDISRLGVPLNPGPNERRCDWLQRMLTPDELTRWMAAANAASDVSDDAIRASEARRATRTTPGTTGTGSRPSA